MEDLYFSEEFVENLSGDTVEAWGQILQRLRSIVLTQDCYASVYGFLLSFAGARGLPVHLPAPTYQPERDMLQLMDLIESLEKRIGPGLDRHRAKEAVGRAQDFYQTKIRGAFAYEFLDSDYNGRTFCITQAFFPDSKAWVKLARALKSVVDPQRFAAFSGTQSLPFNAGERKRIAVKVIDPRGNEVMRVIELGEVAYA